MKKIVALVLLMTFLTHVSFSQTWTEKGAVYPGGGGRATSAFAIPSLGSGYTICGAPNNHQTWQYDTLSDSWNQMQDFPGGADGTMVGFSINDTGYVGAGVSWGCGFYNEFYMYDPVADQWTQLANVPGSARGYAVGFAVGGKGYIGGGITGCNGNGLNDFYCYDPKTGKWDTIAPYPGKGSGLLAIGFAIGNYGYVGTGDSVGTNGSSFTPQKDFWRYDPSNNTWTKMADFGGGVRGGASGFATCDKGFIGLGYNDPNQSVVQNDFWQYDPAKNSWTQIANFGGAARQVAPSFVVGKSCFVALGVGAAPSYSTLTDIWEYIPSVTPAFTTIGVDSSTIICQGGSITFKDTSNFSPTNWYWQFPGGTPDTSTSDSVTITYVDTGYHYVILTAWNGCDSATKTFTNYIHVGAGGLLAISPSPDTICNGQSSIVHIKGGGSGFIWTPTTGITDSTVSGDSITISPTANTIYSVTGTGTGGCDFYGTDTVTIKSASLFNILPLDTGFCSGQSAVLYVQGGGSGFIWTPISGITDSSQSLNQDSVTVSPTVTTTYSVTGMNTSGCASSGIDIVTIIPSPNKPTFTQNGNTLMSSSQYDNQWYRNDTLLLNDTSQDLTITIPGEYWVVVNNEANGCSTSSDTVYVKLAGINQLSIINDQLSIYPNPFDNSIFIKINSLAEDVKDWKLQITDELGRIIYGRMALNYSNDIDLSNLASGVYFITVINKTGRAVLPVVKQN